jgi:hypothetical protein
MTHYDYVYSYRNSNSNFSSYAMVGWLSGRGKGRSVEAARMDHPFGYDDGITESLTFSQN